MTNFTLENLSVNDMKLADRVVKKGELEKNNWGSPYNSWTTYRTLLQDKLKSEFCTGRYRKKLRLRVNALNRIIAESERQEQKWNEEQQWQEEVNRRYEEERMEEFLREGKF